MCVCDFCVYFVVTYYSLLHIHYLGDTFSCFVVVVVLSGHYVFGLWVFECLWVCVKVYFVCWAILLVLV